MHLAVKFGILSALVWSGAGMAWAAESVETFSFVPYIKAVGQGHPERKADEATVRAARESLGNVGLVPDPMISLGREGIPVKEAPMEGDAESMSDAPAEESMSDKTAWALGVSQEIPWPGKLSASKTVAEKRVFETEAAVRVATLQRVFDAAFLYLDLVEAEQVIRLQQENLREVKSLGDLLHRRRKQGVGNHSEALELRVAEVLAERELDSQQARRSLLMRWARAAAGASEQSQFSLAAWPSRADVESAVVVALGEPPADRELQRIQAAAETARAKAALDGYATRPSLTTSLEVMREDSGNVMLNVMAGVRVPLFSGKGVQASQRRLTEELEAVRARTDWYERKKILAAQMSGERLRVLERHAATLEKDLKILAEDHYRLIVAEYAAGRRPFSDVTEAHRKLIELRIETARAQANLLREILRKQGIALGLAETALDQSVPGPGGSLNMAGGAMQSGSMTNGGMQKNGKDMSKPMSPAAGQMPSPDMEDTEEEGGGGGSGMSM